MSDEPIKIIDGNDSLPEIKTFEPIIAETVEEIEVYVDETMGWAGGDATRHYSLLGRNDTNQHEIKAIVGLREELDEIKRLKTVYSDKIGVADYYPWSDGLHDEYGYFVSVVPNTTNVEICKGEDIFGVTVFDAGFVGGQDANEPRGNGYALVATSGLVNVRCESSVVEGDYVVSNSYGVATKTGSGCGYKVVAIEYKDGVAYAVIYLGVQANVIDSLGKQIETLDGRLGAAEINIAAARNAANDAYNKVDEYSGSNQEISNKVDNAIGIIGDVVSDVENIGKQLTNAVSISAQAKAFADAAARSAESIRDEAVEYANEALDRASEIERIVEPISRWEYVDPATGITHTGATYFDEYVKNGLSTKAEMEAVSRLDEENKMLIEQNAENYQRLLSSVDKYSVGEYSQACGLTVQQSRSILKEGMVYIPTKHGSAITHVENYIDGENVLSREFTHGYYYEWSILEDGQYMWSEKIGEVWFGTEEPAGTAYEYWYDGSVLYILLNGQYIQVATLSGNVNNRITSMVRQAANEVALEVANARGSAASLTNRITDIAAEVVSLASWAKGEGEDGERYNLASIQQKVDGASADIALVVQEKDGEKVINRASIVAAINEDSSSVGINADNIVMTGTTTFLKPEDVGDDGSTVISGSRITTGQIDAEKVNVINLKASNIVVSGTGDDTKTVDEALANTISSSTIYYALSTSTKTPPDDDAWDTEAPEKERKKYMWQKTVNVYGDGSIEESVACIAGADGEGHIVVDIQSSAGTIYINNEISTTLIAKAYQDNEDITGEFPDEAFLWEKYNMYGIKDEEWSQTGKTINVGNSDIYKRAMFNCVLDVEQRL